MKYRDFGSTGFKVSALGVGCMRLPTQKMRLQKIDVPKAREIVQTAVDKGINYIYTGWYYRFGESEKASAKPFRPAISIRTCFMD
jgi:uncharacterized protein